jgi:hypothetical protein
MSFSYWSSAPRTEKSKSFWFFLKKELLPYLYHGWRRPA